MDNTALARIGFTLIRNLLKTKSNNDIQIAFELAESLHNLPETGNQFQQDLTINNIKTFCQKHPDLSSHFEGLAEDQEE